MSLGCQDGHKKGTISTDRQSSGDGFDGSEDGVVLFKMDDDVLTKKMALVNDAINRIGFTPYHWKLFCLNGMGYAVDSLLTFLHSVCQDRIKAEFLFKDDFNPLVSADYVGLFVGTLFWGFSSDIIGRRIAFHITLFGTALFGLAGAGGLNFVAVCSLSAVCYSFAGGNLVLDAVTFLEFLPSHKQWMLTFMAFWWGLGQIITCAIAWPLIANFSCGDVRAGHEEWEANPCLRSDNMGWRYTYICCGGFVLLCALARIWVIKMVETPKYEIVNGNDENVIAILDRLAASGKAVNPLTVADLQSCGTVKHDTSDKRLLDKIQPGFVLQSLCKNLKGLYSNRTLGLSASLSFFSWTLIGLAYPLYVTFLPAYLKSRGADMGDGTLYTTYRNNLIVTTCSIFGPVIGGMVCDTPKFGRRGTLALGGIMSMVFMFVYTKAETPAQNLGINCAINVFVNVYYGTLYAYTPETLPAAYRATGSGISVALNRVMGTIAPVIGFYAGIETPAPIYVLAALFGGMAIVALCFPYEVRGKNSM